jgi:phosphate transport system protein
MVKGFFRMVEHTVKSFDSELETLRQGIIEMGWHAKKILSDSVEALMSLDVDLARSVVSAETRLDAQQRLIAGNAIGEIARRQPLAADLREIIGAIRISSDLERIGDLARSIAKRTPKVAGAPNVQRGLVSIKPIYDRVADQLDDVLHAYERQDAALAKAVWERDINVDALEDLAIRDLLTFMMEDPLGIPLCTQLLFTAKNLERAGDHATNIAETIVYVVTGEPLPNERPHGHDSKSAT